ncbi:aldehyde oxidase GLOX [Ziziphus jujuba]|uniref:Aldehyde oxidase GLOX n=1 Tax=Ziziphus jujuba TaxID=326968 RepID=A0A6P4AM99_ZIZJJ|nr:aldehyde oxidase GLOX [Ziziphus jujuba]
MAEQRSVSLLMAICLCFYFAQGNQAYEGKWKLLKKSIGISAMHMALLPNNKVIMFDRSNFGPSNISLPQRKCQKGILLSTDCYAHSVEFDPSNRNVRPLTILTDTWCSSGALSQDGVLIQSGGSGAGERVVRYFKPCVECDWAEDPNGLNVPRWYASNQILPNGKTIVVGGRFQFSYEFIPKTSPSDQILYQLPFLRETRHSAMIPNNFYPFVHLSPDGNLFIFANDRAILLDYIKNKVIRKFPVMPGGVSRNYPSTGSSVLLPLNLSGKSNAGFPEAEVLVCGGTLPDSNAKAAMGVFIPASKSCGRLRFTAENPTWEMEEMPRKRVMGDMILLPTGDVLIINGAAKGTAGWNMASEPVLHPVVYRPWRNNAKADRFDILSPADIPRLYHSTAHLLSDGRVLVGGSNPNWNYNFSTVHPTELSVEAFYPPYLSPTKSRPLISWIKPGVELGYKQKINVGFKSKKRPGKVYLTMVSPSFTTHSFAMNQRLLVLDAGPVVESENSAGSNFVVEGFAPATPELAPAGYYLLFVVGDDVPSRGTWVRIK